MMESTSSLKRLPAGCLWSVVRQWCGLSPGLSCLSAQLTSLTWSEGGAAGSMFRLLQWQCSYFSYSFMKRSGFKTVMLDVGGVQARSVLWVWIFVVLVLKSSSLVNKTPTQSDICWSHVEICFLLFLRAEAEVVIDKCQHNCDKLVSMVVKMFTNNKHV